MANIGETEMALARVYASAMIALAEKQGEMGFLESELVELVSFMDQDAALERFLDSPMVDADARERSIEKIFRGRASDLLVNSLQVLNRKGRLGLIRGVVEAYRHERQEREGRIEVRVSSATALSEFARQRLHEILKSKTGCDVDLVEKVNPDLIGGLVIHMGDQKFDASIAHRIQRLSKSLRRRTREELYGGRSYVADSAA